VPHHSARLQLEERVQRLAIGARTCADLADHQGLSRAADQLQAHFAELLALASALSENRQPKLWSVPSTAARAPDQAAAS
jgi:hypothetical protein